MTKEEGVLENPIKSRRQFNVMRMGADRIKDGTGINPGEKGAKNLINSFGCLNCTWKGTDLCPHGLTGLQVHGNKICSQRALYIKELLVNATGPIKVFQVEQVVNIKLMLDNMYKEYAQGKDLDRQFSSIQKNMISLLDKMRKQDEGIKISGEISHTVKQFQEVVETQAKTVETKDIVHEARLIREQQEKQNATDQQDN